MGKSGTCFRCCGKGVLFLRVVVFIFCGIFMFQGTSLLSLDAKGRLSMPARHRESLVLSCQGEVTVTRHPDGCVLIYPRAAWLELRPSLVKLPYSARVLQRIV